MPVAGRAEAPAQVDGAADADAGPLQQHGLTPGLGARSNLDGAAREACPVLGQLDSQRLGELAGPRAEVLLARYAIADRPAAFAHRLDAHNGRERPDEHG